MQLTSSPACVVLIFQIFVQSLPKTNFAPIDQEICSMIKFRLIVVFHALSFEFLKSQRIMDYSLLLGVHYRAPQHLRTRASYRRTMTAERLTVLSEEGKTHLYLPVNGFYQHVTI